MPDTQSGDESRLTASDADRDGQLDWTVSCARKIHAVGRATSARRTEERDGQYDLSSWTRTSTPLYPFIRSRRSIGRRRDGFLNAEELAAAKALL